VELLDVYPTLAQLAGVTPPTDLHGRSLVPLLSRPDAPWDHPALTQVRRGPAAEQFMGYSVRTDKWRYTEWDNGKRGLELYDEVRDPAEMHNLASVKEHESVLAEMKQLLGKMKTR
jgi:uncharacterized sulfatase